MIFYSKHDFWLGAFVFGITIPLSILIFVGTGFSYFSLIIILTLLLLVWIWFGTHYTIKDNTLIVRCAFFSQKLDINQIDKIKKTKSNTSSPACSLDRIEIFTHTSTVIISPKNKTAFINMLMDLNSDIIVDL